MNFFSSDGFLEVVADVFYPGRPCHVGPARVQNKQFRTLILQKPHKVLSRMPFLDFFEECDSSSEGAPKARGTVPLSIGLVTSDEWQGQSLANSNLMPAPQVMWNRFDNWQAYLGYVKGKSPFPFNVSKRKLRKLERDIGEVSFSFHDPDPAALQRCMQWKSAQYARTGLWDLFASKRNVRLFFELNRRGLLTTTTLRAGPRLVGVHVGMVHEGRFYSWLPAYDPQTAPYSPGTLLFDYLLRESFQAKHAVFDFLIGDEAYKWNYATHTHLIQQYGTPSMAKRLYQPLRELVLERVRGDNLYYRKLQSLKRWALERRLRRE